MASRNSYQPVVGASGRGLSMIPLLALQGLSLAGYFVVSWLQARPITTLGFAYLCLPLLVSSFLIGFARRQLMFLSFCVVVTTVALGFLSDSLGPYVVGLLAVPLLLAGIPSGRAPRQTPACDGTGRRRGYAALVFFVALLASALAASLRGFLNVGMVMGLATFVLAGLVVRSVLFYPEDPKQIRRIVHVLVFTALALSVIWLPAAIGALGKRMYLPFGLGKSGLNEFGGTLAMLAVLTMGLITFETKRPRSRLLWITFVVLSVGLLLSQSRGAWVGMLAGLIYIFVKRKRIRSLLVPLAIIVLVLSVVHPARSRFTQRIAQTEADDPAWLGRVLMWQTAAQIVPRNLLLGIGLHNFGLAKYDYGFPRSFDPVRPSFYYRPSSAAFGHTHNVYLELLMGAGLIGFIAFMAILLSTLFGLSQVAGASGPPKLRGPALGLAALLIAHMVHSVFDYTFWIVRSLAFYAMVLGLALAVLRQAARVSGVQQCLSVANDAADSAGGPGEIRSAD